MKKLTILVLGILMSLLLIGCNTTQTSTELTTSPSTSIPSSQITTEEVITPSDLINDEYATGNYYGDAGISRTPFDPAFQLLESRTQPLDVGQSYTEGFENDFLNSKIYPYRTDIGADFSFVQGGIEDTTLILESNGNYAGVYLNGMKFTANSSYIVSFDYKILSGANEFFIQFRSLNGGTSSDVYANVSTENSNVNNYSFQVDLGNYNDYELMIFPRFDSCIIAIDNITITRIDSKPLIRDYEIIGDYTLGSTLTVQYEYYDAEDHLEGDTLIAWYTTIDASGTNKELIAYDEMSVVITNDYFGKYIMCEITPVSTGVTATNNIGIPSTVYSEKLSGISVTQVNINLGAHETFTEDFEEDITVINNMYFEEIDAARAYIESDGLDKKLVISGDKPFGGITFSGITFAMNQTYNISFDYRIIEMPSNIYVQMRTDVGLLEHDKYIDINLQDKQINVDYHFNGNFGLDSYSDYKLMIFFGNQSGHIEIDNIRVENIDVMHYQVNSIELEVGEYIYEDFDSNSRYLGFDYSQVPNSSVMNNVDYAISGNSLYFESSGNYLCLFINQGLIFTPNATYRISFDYKIIELQDTIYFQFNGGAYGNVFTQFGSAQDVNIVSSFTYDFEISDTSNYVIQIFPGQSIGNTIVIIDNIKIERIN